MKPAALLLAACFLAIPAGAITPKPPKASPSHKAKAPITVTTVFGEAKATITVRFDQAVEDAAIGVRGLDGLQVAAMPPVEKSSFARGEVLVLEVPFTPGPGLSHLAVDLEGRFRGQRRMAVQTFAVGKPSAEQLKAAQGKVLTLSGGQRIKVMPVRQD